jgi:aromatic ring-opening dioxygenase catalytic subunit (LigB family)
MTPTTLPVVYIPHGGGPWAFVDIGMAKAEAEALKAYLRTVRTLSKTPPKALLVVSAHWEEARPTVMTAARPPILYDYYGFPDEAYRIAWPAPGDPALAARVRALLGGAGIETAEDPARGFDHGTFIPLKVAFPDAEVPTVQLSLKAGLDPAEHLAIGRALAPLRDEGVLIVGSGMSFHNMRAFRSHTPTSEAEAFDAWLGKTAASEPAERDRRLERWAEAPGARQSHPREEHLVPLMVVAGAAGEDRGSVPFRGNVMGFPTSAVQFG